MASAVARFRREGGKGRLGGGLAADDAQGAGEREPVRVELCLVGGLGHELSDGVVGDEEPVELLQDEVGVRERRMTAGPRWWVFISSKVSSISQRWWYAAARSGAGASWWSRMLVTRVTTSPPRPGTS